MRTHSVSVTHASSLLPPCSPPPPLPPPSPPPRCTPPPFCLQLLYDKERATSESRKQAADKAADELRQEAAKRQRLEDTNRVSADDADGGFWRDAVTTLRQGWWEEQKYGKTQDALRQHKPCTAS